MNTLKLKTINTQTMKAAVCTKYGSPEVLEVKKVSIPVPNENDILVKVYASTTTTADSMMRRADPFISRFFLGFNKPRKDITGTGFAGKIIKVGNNVTHFKEGDEVFGETGTEFGANAEFICMPEEGVVLKKPQNLSFQEASPICDGILTSWNFLKEIAQIKSGQSVLINGASGSLGIAGIQIAKILGAEVTGVCSYRNVELVKFMGANHVIDYTKEDFTKSPMQYDVIYDTLGKIPFSDAKKALVENGTYLAPVLSFSLLIKAIVTSFFGSKKAKFSATGLLPSPKLRAMLDEILPLMETERIQTLVSKTYQLDQIQEAHREIDSGRKVGNIVLTFTE